MKKANIFNLILIVLIISAVVVYAIPKVNKNETKKWVNLEKGIDFLTFDFKKKFRQGKVYIVKVNPKLKKLRILKNEINKTNIRRLNKKYKPFLIINGSYFEENYKPVGLLKIEKKIYHGLNKLGWSGVLAIKNNKVEILHKNRINKISGYEYLMQNGPIIIEPDNKIGIYSDDKIYSSRTAIGLDQEGNVLIIVADNNASPSLWELANFLKQKEILKTNVVLNLDGGSSTGLIINLENDKLIIEGRDFIANGIGVF